MESVEHKSPWASILRDSPTSPSKKIQAILMLNDETLADLARRLHRSRTYICMVLTGARTSPPLQRSIAADLNVQVDDIWTPADAA